jgi:hypothetical protein
MNSKCHEPIRCLFFSLRRGTASSRRLVSCVLCLRLARRLPPLSVCTQAPHPTMALAQRRLASAAAKLASIPLSSLKQFPPKEALTSSSSSTFSPETWATLQPPPPSALSALGHRIGYGSVLQIPELEQACTHPSVLPLFVKRHPNQKPPPANGNLSTLGNALLGLFASEFVVASYPHLPTRVVKAAVSAYVGPNTCANVATDVGAAPLLRWCRTVRLSHPLTPFSLCDSITSA